MDHGSTYGCETPPPRPPTPHTVATATVTLVHSKSLLCAVIMETSLLASFPICYVLGVGLGQVHQSFGLLNL